MIHGTDYFFINCYFIMNSIIKKQLDYVAETAYIDDNILPSNIRDYIDKIVKTLRVNQWITLQKNKLETKYLKINTKLDNTYHKPPGLYFSKGEWLFHEIILDPDEDFYDHYINIANIDMSNMLLITDYKKVLNMNKKYIKKWNELIKDYDGLIIIQNLGGMFSYYDVSTLVTWKYNKIKSHIAIGKLGDFIKRDDIKNGNMDNIEEGIQRLIIAIKNASEALICMKKYNKLKNS